MSYIMFILLLDTLSKATNMFWKKQHNHDTEG